MNLALQGLCVVFYWICNERGTRRHQQTNTRWKKKLQDQDKTLLRSLASRWKEQNHVRRTNWNNCKQTKYQQHAVLLKSMGSVLVDVLMKGKHAAQYIVHNRKCAYQPHSLGIRPALAFAVTEGDCNGGKQTRHQHSNKYRGTWWRWWWWWWWGPSHTQLQTSWRDMVVVKRSMLM